MMYQQDQSNQQKGLPALRLSGDTPTHLLFWTLVLILLIWLEPAELGIGFAIGKSLLQMVFYMVIVYSNILYFFPKYLKQRRILKHLGALILFSALLTPIKIAVFYLIYSRSPDIQFYVLSNQVNIFLSCFLLAVASTLWCILQDWVRGQRLRQEIQNKSLQTELNFLKSQINPHFLFNTLNNLYALTLKKSDMAPAIVLRLSEMMRYLLYECNESRVPLQKEVGFVESYIELEKLRQGKGFDIKLQVTGDPEGHLIAPQLLIPFIENCFKHGLNRSINAGYVHIDIQIEDDQLVMQVANSKAPEEEKRNGPKRVGGIGLTNVKRRLNLLYPDGYQLQINNGLDRYEVTFRIILKRQRQNTLAS